MLADKVEMGVVGDADCGMPPATAEAPLSPGTLRQKMDEYERALIVDALQAARGNRAKAARILGITERIMGLRVKKYGIDARVYRSC